MTELKIPRPGESINEVVLSKWFFPDGALVKQDQEVGEIESDKATLPLIAPVSGRLMIRVAEGTTVSVGTVACVIDESVAVSEDGQSAVKDEKNRARETVASQAATSTKKTTEVEHTAETVTTSKPLSELPVEDKSRIKVSPLAQKLMDEHHLSLDDVLRGLRRLRKEDVEMVIKMQSQPGAVVGDREPAQSAAEYRREERRPLTQLRKKLSQRLVSAKNETAMLTTFNEIDMSQ
ncbi:MAG: biotin/lipoyl-containing protein, partial [Bacteroidales bacterium]